MQVRYSGPATFGGSPAWASHPASGGDFPRAQPPRLLPRQRMPSTALRQTFASMIASSRWSQAAKMAVVARRVSVARLGGARQTRNHPNDPPKVAGPLHQSAAMR